MPTGTAAAVLSTTATGYTQYIDRPGFIEND